MLISGIVKSSLVDYPGHIVCVLFVPGCNYNCFYCHNRSLIDGNHNLISLQYVNDFLTKRQGVLDGIVITGGEPTLQTDLISYIEYLKKFNYKIKLDTNGSSPQVIEVILQKGLCDYFAVDYKTPSYKYQETCGAIADSETVLKTIEILLHNKANFEVRTTVIPQLNKEDIINIAKELPLLPRFVLNPYRKPSDYLPEDQLKIDQKPYTNSEIQSFAELIKAYQPNVIY